MKISRNDYLIAEGAYRCSDALLDLLEELHCELDDVYGERS